MTDLTPEQRVTKLRENRCPHEYGVPSHLQRCQEECPDCILNEIRAAEQAAIAAAVAKIDIALQAGRTEYSRDAGEPEPTPAFPVRVVFSMHQWDVVLKALAPQVVRAKRGLLIPRAEHEAAIAAVVEKAAKETLTHHKITCPSHDRWPEDEDAAWMFCNCGIKGIYQNIRSIASQAEQDALREAKAETEAIVEAEWRLELWQLLFPEGTHTEFEPQDIARWIDAYTKEVETDVQARAVLDAIADTAHAGHVPQTPNGVAVEELCQKREAQAVNAAQDDLFSLLMNVAQLLNTLEEQQRATKWTRQIKVDVDKQLEAMDKIKGEL